MNIDWSDRANKAVKDGSEDERQCKPFDFNRCSLDQSLKDYPQLFEFQKDQIM